MSRSRSRLTIFLILGLLLGVLCICVISPAITIIPSVISEMSRPKPTPPVLEIMGWEGMQLRTLCLEIQVDGHLTATTEIEEALRYILFKMGLHITDNKATCETVLTIHMRGEALGADYFPGGYCYTGAEVSGKVTLSAPGRTPLILPIQGREDPPSGFIGGCNKDPLKAPFEEAWSKALMDGLTNIWGWHPAVAAIDSPHFYMREAAFTALKKMGPEVKEAIPFLIQALGHWDPETRNAAIDVLINIAPEAKEEVIHSLIKALKDKNANRRQAAARALGGIGPKAKEAVPALIQALNDKDYGVRQAALVALRAITGQHFGNDALRWQEWWDKQK